ncbi:unnamed protein product [Ambrosiozyma monospora]|uniref:Unnamed protein product n=1 Tax=Ambrosiozyma monospora TaxID=43982 RepID=A0ACB5TD44_AMBMO|nr:unnamed protein product [Ambrosiozyma monospora]
MLATSIFALASAMMMATVEAVPVHKISPTNFEKRGSIGDAYGFVPVTYTIDNTVYTTEVPIDIPVNEKRGNIGDAYGFVPVTYTIDNTVYTTDIPIDIPAKEKRGNIGDAYGFVPVTYTIANVVRTTEVPIDIPVDKRDAETAHGQNLGDPAVFAPRQYW